MGARTPGLFPGTRLLGDPLCVPRLQEGQCSSASLEGTVSLHPGGPGQRAMTSQLRQELVLLLVLGGKKGEGPADPTGETWSSLQSWITSLELTALLFYSSPPKSCHLLQLSMCCLSSDLLPPNPAHPPMLDGDRFWPGTGWGRGSGRAGSPQAVVGVCEPRSHRRSQHPPGVTASCSRLPGRRLPGCPS